MSALLLAVALAPLVILVSYTIYQIHGMAREDHRRSKTSLERRLFAEKTWRAMKQEKQLEFEMLRSAISPKRLKKKGDEKRQGAITIIEDTDRGALSLSDDDRRGGLTKPS